MRRRETLVQWSLAAVALSAIAVLALIIIFIFKEGSPIIARLGMAQFIAGTKWSPTRGMFGILPMILGSVWVTLGALIIGVPIGLATAIFLAEMAPSQNKPDPQNPPYNFWRESHPSYLASSDLSFSSPS